MTLITVQNTRGVSRVSVLAPDLVKEQIYAVVSDIPPQAVKTGALGNQAVIEAVAQSASSFPFPLVVDPVMISKHGAPLLEEPARRALIDLLIPQAFLLTPNLPEAQALAGFPVHDPDSMRLAAEALVRLGAKNVLVKGGHLEGDAVDVLYIPGTGFQEFREARIDTPNTHGTGCTYSAAITAGLAKGESLPHAVAIAKSFITRAIRTNPGLGSGHGPLNHMA